PKLCKGSVSTPPKTLLLGKIQYGSERFVLFRPNALLFWGTCPTKRPKTPGSEDQYRLWGYLYQGRGPVSRGLHLQQGRSKAGTVRAPGGGYVVRYRHFLYR